MNAAQYTPGAWEAEHRRSEPPSQADDPGYWSVDGEVAADCYGVVADTLNRDHRISPEEDQANARLIAAAKLLLAACKAQHEAIDRLFAMLIEATKDQKPHCFFPTECGQPWEAVLLGKFAIAKAEFRS